MVGDLLRTMKTMQQ